MNELKGHQHREHQHRNDLAGEHRWGDLVQLIFLLLFLIIWVGDSFFLKLTTQPAQWIPWFVRIPLGVCVLIGAFLLARSGLKIMFGEERNPPEVVDKGVFSVVRHPIYLGAILLYLGLIFLTASIAALGFWVVIVVFYMLISWYEERLLIQMFGQAYQDYKKRVPMLFPWLK